MTSPAPRSVYTERLADRNGRLKGFESRRNQLGLWRLLAMIAVGVAIWFSVQKQVPWWSAGFPLAIFVALVWWQSRIERDAEFVRRAIRFHEAGILVQRPATARHSTARRCLRRTAPRRV